MKKRNRRIIFYVLPCTIALAVFSLVTKMGPNGSPIGGKKLVCALDLEGYQSDGVRYSCGLNYELLRLFSSDSRCKSAISLAEGSSLDSLSGHVLDLVILPYRDSFPEEFSVCGPLSDSTVWVSRKEDKALATEIERWHMVEANSQEYSDLKERFSPSYEPYRRAAMGRRFKYAGPYDELIKKYAATLGWDWRLLTAVVWQESRFHIEARSRRGAAGLMQMMPRTAGKYGIEDSLDPEENLRAAAKYFSRLQRMFKGYASGAELAKFTLAAYNAGEGRVLDCINFAKSSGKPYSSWNDLKAIIPSMRDADVMDKDTVTRLGVFKGYETIAYVDKVLELYSMFRAIVPGPSSPDPLLTRKEKEAEVPPLSQDTTASPQPAAPADSNALGQTK